MPPVPRAKPMQAGTDMPPSDDAVDPAGEQLGEVASQPDPRDIYRRAVALFDKQAASEPVPNAKRVRLRNAWAKGTAGRKGNARPRLEPQPKDVRVVSAASFARPPAPKRSSKGSRQSVAIAFVALNDSVSEAEKRKLHKFTSKIGTANRVHVVVGPGSGKSASERLMRAVRRVEAVKSLLPVALEVRQTFDKGQPANIIQVELMQLPAPAAEGPQ